MKCKTHGFIAVFLLAVFIVNIILLLSLTVSDGDADSEDFDAVEILVLQAPDCPDCFDATLYLAEFETLGIATEEAKIIAYDDAAKHIKKHDVTKLPALILSEALSAYPTVATAWERVGTRSEDGSYVLQGSPPPFYDLEQERVRGVIDLLYLEDAGCTDCYDVTSHRVILERFGMKISEERSVDVASNEGKALLAEYDVTKIPTVIAEGEATLYPGFESAWQSVGRAEGEVYIFTNLDALGQPYKDLSTGDVVLPNRS